MLFPDQDAWTLVREIGIGALYLVTNGASSQGIVGDVKQAVIKRRIWLKPAIVLSCR